MKIRNFFLGLLLTVVGTIFAQPGMQMPPIPVDTAVHMGKLDNGLTYYIRYNNWPENKVNFYIAQRVGSIQENDDQRGLAHFLEHMAFNGSEHFPDSALLEYTRSLGVEFGSNLNAYTSIDQTVYRICDVPTKRATAVDSCLLILKDWSNGLTLASKEIDKERGVIHQEWQMGEGPMQRMIQKALPKMYPGSKYGHRMPIGLMEIVDNFPPQVLRDYYKKWYRPDNQAIIIVGDVDVKHMEDYIKQLWSGVTVPPDASKVVEELVPDNDTAIYVMEKDKEQQYSMVSLAMKHDPVPEEMKSTMTYMVMEYVNALTSLMLNQRLSEAALKPDCPFVDASAEYSQYFLSKTKDAFQLDAYAKEGQDRATLAALYREALRAKKYGFVLSEFQRAKDELMSQAEKRYENRKKITNASFGNQYRDHFLDNEPIPSVEDEFQIVKQILPAITIDVVNQYAHEVISDNDSNLVVLSFAQEKEGKEYLTDGIMAQTIAAVRSEKLEAYVDQVKNEPLIAPEALPKKGKIKKEKENKILGYKELTLSNGARVLLKKTNFKDDEILFQAMAKGGKSLYGPSDYANLKFFDLATSSCGLGNFTNMEVTKALYGKQVDVKMGMGNYYQTLSGNTVPKDLETMMQLIYLNFTSLKEDKQSYQSSISQVELMLKNKGLSPESAFGDSVPATLYSHNPRFLAVDTTDAKKASQSRICQIAHERFANAGEFVFYFIGNFEEETIRPLIEQYIASLPGKKKKGEWKDVVSIATGKVTNKFTRKMMSPKAIAYELWHQPIEGTLENEVLADAAGQVLSMVYLKDIREDASAAYSVGASGYILRLGDKFNFLVQAYCPMDPKKSQTALELLAKGIADNSVKVDADKVAKVKENLLKNADADAKKNRYWMDILDEYVWTNRDLYTDYIKVVNSISPEKIAAFLKNLLDAGNHIEIVMTPSE